MAIDSQSVFRGIWEFGKTNHILRDFTNLECPHCGEKFVMHSGLSCPGGRSFWPLSDFLAKLREKDFSVSLSDISKLVKRKNT